MPPLPPMLSSQVMLKNTNNSLLTELAKTERDFAINKKSAKRAMRFKGNETCLQQWEKPKPETSCSTNHLTYQNCRGWLSVHGQRCSNPQYQPSEAAFWGLGQTQYQFLWVRESDVPVLSHICLSPEIQKYTKL